MSAPDPSRPGEARHRSRWTWDSVAWGSHCVDCYPGNCSYRLYVRDGKVVREEVAGAGEPSSGSLPDGLPLGCNKGAAWSAQIEGPDRVRWPMRRVGERGSGAWERLSWDDALDAVADVLVDTIEADGPGAILREGTPQVGVGLAPDRFVHLLGGTVTDLNGAINDFANGLHITFGKSNPVYSPRSVFEADVLLLWHINPAYTLIPVYHWMTEARYRGAEVVLFSPDVNPTHSHVDYAVPVRWGADAAVVLAMCQVVVAEGLVDEGFVATQTDLSLLVRTDTERFLRESDVVAGGHEEQFFHLDPGRGVVPADRANLLCDYEPALRGRTTVTLADGGEVVVAPLFERVASLLADYTPEAAAEVAGTHPETIRTVARKVAAGRTYAAIGGGAEKLYHGDLFQRSAHLLLGLTGNWGRPGAGTTSWSVPHGDGSLLTSAKRTPGPEGAEVVLALLESLAAAVKASDPTMSDELAAFALHRGPLADKAMVPPFFFWYWHAGFAERLNNTAWGDPTMKRTYDEYVQEALDEGWWAGFDRPGPDDTPRVLIECGGNILRRTRGGGRLLLEHLWPKLELIVTIDFRMSLTALHSDVVLPAAQPYEKVGTHMPSMELTLSDSAVEPVDDALPEWEIFAGLCRAVERRAAARGLEHFRHSGGARRRYDKLWAAFTLKGVLRTTEHVVDETIRDAAYAGILPEGTTLESLRESGRMNFTGWGVTAFGQSQAADWQDDVRTVVPWSNHVEKGDPYPTLTRRAQFLVEHPWFVEAGEDLPCHKEPPQMGGPGRYWMTTGHNRWSIHAMNMANPWLIQTHRGEPHVVVHPEDAAREGIADHQPVRVSNEAGSFVVRAKLSPTQRPGGVTVYSGWDGHQFPGWNPPSDVEPSLVKHLGLAAGYGHLRYGPMEWQPVPCDRPVAVDIEAVVAGGGGGGGPPPPPPGGGGRGRPPPPPARPGAPASPHHDTTGMAVAPETKVLAHERPTVFHRRGIDEPVRRVAGERSRQGRGDVRHGRRDRHSADLHRQGLQPGAHRNRHADPVVARQPRQLEPRDPTHSQLVGAGDRLGGGPTQPLRLSRPPLHHVRVEQDGRHWSSQSAPVEKRSSSSAALTATPESRPLRPAGPPAGTRRATGRPLLVMSTSSPAATSSSRARMRAFTSVAVI